MAGLRRELRTRRIAAGGLGDGCSALDLQVVGMGKRAEANVRSLLARRLASPGQQAEPLLGLLLLGFAGAVDPDLETGDLVLSSRYYHVSEDRNPPLPPLRNPPNPPLIKRGTEDSHSLGSKNDRPTQGETQQEYFTADPVMWRHAIEAAGRLDRPVVQVESLTVDDLVTTPQSKEAIRQSYKVGVVDMEDYWVASVARDAGVPFLSARVVLDRADQTLPSYLPGLANSRAMAILLTALKPWRIPVLLGLARRLPEAQRILARFTLIFQAQVTSNQPAHSHPAAVGPGVQNGSGRSTTG